MGESRTEIWIRFLEALAIGLSVSRVVFWYTSPRKKTASDYLVGAEYGMQAISEVFRAL